MKSKSNLIRTDVLISVLLFIAFFLATISYVSVIDVSWLKYISIFITMGILAYRVHGKTERNRLMLSVILLMVLILSCLFQPTTLIQKIQSTMFYGVLLGWTLYGNKIFQTTSDVLASISGVTIAVLSVILSTWGMRAQQLADPFNSRHRVYWGFMHPNTLASFAEGIIISALIIYILDRRFHTRVWKFAFACMIIFSAYLIIVTDSRTALLSVLSFIAIIIYYHICHRHPKLRYIITMLFLLAIVVGVGLLLEKYILEDAAFEARIEGIGSIAYSVPTFIFGNGMVAVQELNTANLNGAHGEIALISLLYKNGVIGVVVYIVIFSTFWLQTRGLKTQPQKNLARCLFIAVLVGSAGEAFIVNITNVFSMISLILMSAVSLGPFTRRPGDLLESKG